MAMAASRGSSERKINTHIGWPWPLSPSLLCDHCRGGRSLPHPPLVLAQSATQSSRALLTLDVDDGDAEEEDDTRAEPRVRPNFRLARRHNRVAGPGSMMIIIAVVAGAPDLQLSCPDGREIGAEAIESLQCALINGSRSVSAGGGGDDGGGCCCCAREPKPSPVGSLKLQISTSPLLLAQQPAGLVINIVSPPPDAACR